MNAAVIMVGLIALAIGALIGWLFGGREAAGAKETVGNLRLQLDEVVRERDANRDAATRLAALEASQLEREKGFEARITELVEAKEALSTQFAEISNKLLAEAQETFLKRADQRFRQSEENAGQNLKALLQPVHERAPPRNRKRTLRRFLFAHNRNRLAARRFSTGIRRPPCPFAR